MLVLGVLTVVVVSVQQLRQGTLATAEATGRRLVRVIEEQTVGNIAAVDVALAGMATTLRLLSARGSGRKEEVHGLLLENVRKLPFLRAIWVLNSAGDMIHDSESLPGRYNLSDREYFRVQRDHPERGLSVYGPILSKHGVWFIGVSRRLSNPDGSFAGVIAAALEPKYLQRFYESIDVGEQGVVALMHLDGTLIVRAPAAEGGIGSKFSSAPALAGDGPTAGVYRAVSPEGVARIYAYRRLAGWPLVVVAGLGEAEILAGWWTLARVYALASLAFVLAISWLGYLLLRELQRRSALTRALASDIAVRKRTEAVLDGQGRALELIALGAPLPRTLELLVRTVEEQAPGMLGSVLLLDADGVHLRHGAAPSLPEAYVRGIDDEPIGPSAGSCGTAAYRREAVIVEDIAADPLWRDYRELAAAHGLRACWSTPIFDAQQQVLGTFAMYFRTPRRPTDDHQRLIAAVTHIAAIAITKSLEDARLRDLLSRLRLLSRRLVEVSETERRSINRELHDRIGQNLSTLNLNFDLLRSRLPEGSRGELVRRIDDAQKLLESTITQVRSVMAELHPPALDDFGLLAALCAHAEAFSARVGTPIVVHGEEFAPRLPRAVEYSLLRIAQEAVANAAKHAHPKRIEVTLASTPERVTLTIADDGAGFDTGRPRTTSWGLTVMRERAEAAGAALNIESTPGGGTRVVVAAIREAA